MVHVVNGDQLQSLLTVIKYLTKDIEDKEETFEVRGPTAGLIFSWTTWGLGPSEWFVDP